MDLQYFKRFRMEISLYGRDLRLCPVPATYHYLPWEETLLEACALAKFNSFKNELDSSVFPSLGELSGCRRLMTDISRKPGFIPQATWLLVHKLEGREPEYCGTIQGIKDKSGVGAIQNIGIIPAHRNKGLGTNLIIRALDGFRRSGIYRVSLEVTAQNKSAIRLYQRLGFVNVKTIYKTIEPIYME